jgi:hypothetical protein
MITICKSWFEFFTFALRQEMSELCNTHLPWGKRCQSFAIPNTHLPWSKGCQSFPIPIFLEARDVSFENTHLPCSKVCQSFPIRIFVEANRQARDVGILQIPICLEATDVRVFPVPHLPWGKGCQSFANTHLCCTINSWG